MTRRTLLTLLAVGPLARLLPPLPPPRPSDITARLFKVPVDLIRPIPMIEVTAFGDDNHIFVTRIRR